MEMITHNAKVLYFHVKTVFSPRQDFDEEFFTGIRT
jgi:hypothetical protein